MRNSLPLSDFDTPSQDIDEPAAATKAPEKPNKRAAESAPMDIDLPTKRTKISLAPGVDLAE
jgi:hypothetical protein